MSKPAAVDLDVEEEDGKRKEGAEDSVSGGVWGEERGGLEEEEGGSKGGEEVVHADGMGEFNSEGMGTEEAANEEEDGEEEEGEK
ncbi:hypothetical protein MA16_Dca006671 [Dendrobium catenatum]|uniref:Uncharacterized protein n=1 Tax=Dendrobium catenatum TaxID=906689 RepID=A0A2I0X5U8_9ASPA|nr:hypothetical protein MA16_Dca006671 [Dendrobium catenatum]